jgi:hypothetical protein
MNSCNRLELYHTLFSLIVENPRIMPSKIASKLGKTGRGRSPSTFLKHLQKMYERKISQNPRLTIKSFEESPTFAYFCSKENQKSLESTFVKLGNDKRINYVILLSGCDFFLTSRERNLELDRYGLEISKKSRIYTPEFVIPKGYNSQKDEALSQFMNSDFSKGRIPRKVFKDFSWSDIDWKIYETMNCNVRLKFATVAKETGVYPKTAKSHFYERVLPSCVVAHYFFPKGYDFYYKMFLRIRSEYEIGITKALQKWPCTSYVFPLEQECVFVLFHEGTREILRVIQKLEREGIISTYLLYNPLAHAF